MYRPSKGGADLITLSDILALPVFDSIRLAAPCEGFGMRPVHNAGILDFEPFPGSGDAFYPGEIILSSMGFVNDDPTRADKALLMLIENDVAAVALKPIGIKEVSAQVAEASARKKVPIFFYSGEYYEHIITNILALVKQDKEESDKGRALDGLLAEHDSASIRATMYEIAGVTGSTVQCVAVSPKATDECSLYALLGSLREALDDLKKQRGNIEAVFACRYHDCLLAFLSFTRTPIGSFRRDPAPLLAALKPLGRVCIGLGEEVSLSDGDLTVQQALAALQQAQSGDADVVNWAQAQESAFRHVFKTNRMLAQMCGLRTETLLVYDEVNDAELYPTAVVYVENHGDVKATAAALHQHPNTIRYRMKKVRELLGKPEGSDREFYGYLYLILLGR